MRRDRDVWAVVVAVVVDATWREKMFAVYQKPKKRATPSEPRRRKSWRTGMKMMDSRKRRVERQMLKMQTPRV